MDHNHDECHECQVQPMEANGHQMQLVRSCDEEHIYWICLTCDIIDKWPITESEDVMQMMYTTFTIHCLDRLVLQTNE